MNDKPSDSFALQVSREIGQITGQLNSLISKVESMAHTIENLDHRLRTSERDATRMATMIGTLGIIGGGIGSFIINLVFKR